MFGVVSTFYTNFYTILLINQLLAEILFPFLNILTLRKKKKPPKKKKILVI
jgi:hypothetical protein